jgi:threonine/homoserine/homoserine lactone efflux protein
MPSLDTTVAFFGLALLLGFTPGPDNLFVLMQSATHGRRAGFLVVLGLCTGLLVHTAAVVLGLAAVFAASATAFLALKFLGAAYLAWLAWNAWHAPGEDGPHAAAGEQPPLAAGRHGWPWRSAETTWMTSLFPAWCCRRWRCTFRRSSWPFGGRASCHLACRSRSARWMRQWQGLEAKTR